MTTKDDKPEELSPSFRYLFKYSTGLDYLLMLIGAIGAIGMGILQPFLFVFLASFFNGMEESADPGESFYENSLKVVYLLIIFGGIFTVCGWISVMTWVIVGSRQATAYRTAYFKAALNTDQAWFDSNTIAELPGLISNDTLKVERASGDKIVITIFNISMIIAAYVIALIMSTQLALICLFFTPFLVIGLTILNKNIEQSTSAEDKSYNVAGGIAEEALQEIKTVASLNGQRYETHKYCEAIKGSQKSFLMTGIKTGSMLASLQLCFMLLMAMCFMIGAKFIDEKITNWGTGENHNVGNVIIAIYISVMTASNTGTMIPGINMISEGIVAATRIQNFLLNKSSLASGTSKKPISGEIKFENVEFSYPTSKDTKVIKSLSFKLKAGQKLGIVGETGSGKSTVIQLLLRYYDQDSGTIFLDGVDLREYDIKYIRENISVVSQEPVLFNQSIYENIQYGNLSAGEEEITEAAKLAGAYEFIQELPEGFKTSCGSKGSQLSGGQKQRIAIARAIIRHPKLLLLDEATSALDRKTEKQVTDSIEKAFPSCTRITVAQNLLTIKSSTKILMIEKGSVIEEGSHKDLIKNKGKYYNLYKLQKIQSHEETDKIKEDLDENNNAIDQETAKNLKEKEQEEDKALGSLASKKIMKLGREEKYWLLGGCLGAISFGIFQPLCGGLMFGLETAALGSPDQKNLVEDSIRYGYLLIIFAVITFLSIFVQSVCYPKMSSNVVAKIRRKSFKSIVSFDAGFFDMPENNCSALSARLNVDCQMVNSLSGTFIGVLIGMISSLVTANVIAGIYSWEMMLVVLAMFPVLVFAISANVFAQMAGVVKFNYEGESAVAADVLMNYKTTKAFNLEEVMEKRFLDPVHEEAAATKKKSVISGFTYGLGFGLIFLVYALIFWWGAKLIKDGRNTFKDMIVALLTAFVSSNCFFTLGIFIPDIKKGIEAGKRLFKVIEYIPLINIRSRDGQKNEIVGSIEFKEITFSYPNRSYKALKEVSFSLPEGKSMGIIGRTGSGKSTIVQLILRHYNPTLGEILIDGINLKDLNLKHFRSRISIVSQEPVLFSGSIKENISYGIKAQDYEIEEAAKKAQAFDFITSHQDGFDREVGLKGSKLSGGQKQRIAIARAIIRDPKILLMDEATSALDSSTELEVLNNIRNLMSKATCITIAHRLKTIDNCDFVMVMESGKIVEFGERIALKNQGGYYSEMIKNN